MRLPRNAFTLIELLLVMAIMAVVFGMAGASFARSNTRQQAVLGAANELAATFRQARALAMERKQAYSVVFHIQNDPASSGRVLNNRSGGHWYRILGPGGGNMRMVAYTPPYGSFQFGAFNLASAAQSLERNWVDEAHVLPARKVRFLALTDMDYGNYRSGSQDYRQASAERTYPRPWFGWFDGTRLHGWGGYDPDIPGSGFYFWGNDSQITWNGAPDPAAFATRDPKPLTCTNTQDRVLDNWIGADSRSSAPGQPASQVLYTAGSPRPLINASWRDVSLQFLGTGEACWGTFLPARHAWIFSDVQPSYWRNARRGVAERCNGSTSWDINTYYSVGDVRQHWQTEAGNFDQDSGGWFVTLAPDVDSDNDTYPDAKAALDALMPMYRVFVSSFGEIRVIAVSRSAKLPSGMTAFPPTEDWWRTGSNTVNYFGRDRYVGTVAKGTRPVGAPITDFVTTGMLGNRQVWMR